MRRIDGYAVVCELGHIADARGQMPEALRSEAEWAFFQDGLDACEVLAIGRRSHELTPNPRGRLRMVMSRGLHSMVMEDGLGMIWNPDGCSLQDALDAMDQPDADVAVVGGQGVFDHFLTGPDRYTTFFLSRIDGTAIEGGMDLFSSMEDGRTPEDVLREHGYRRGAEIRLDERASVTAWVP